MALTLNPNVGRLNQTTTSTSFVVPTPTGYAAGDVLFVVLNVDSKTATVTTPTGWTLDQDIQTSVSLGNRTRTYWRAADGTEGSSVTFAVSAAQRGSGAMLGFTGADCVNPILAKATANNSTSSTSQAAPSVTPTATVTGGILVCSMSAFINGSYTPPTGMTEVADQPNVDTTTTVAIQTGMTTAATGSKTFTASTSSASIATTTLIRPAVSATASVPAGSTGDLLFAEAFFYNQGGVAFGAFSDPAGWNPIDRATVSGVDYLPLSTFYRIADGTEPASYDFFASNGTGKGGGSAFISRFAGPWAASPLDAHSTQQNASSTSATAPSVTVTQAGSLAIMSIARNSSSNTISAMPSGFSADQNGAIPTPTYRHDSLTNPAIASGATGALTATMSAAAANVAFIAIFTPYVSSVNATVAATVLTGSGAMPAPTVTATRNPTIAAVVLAGSGLLPVPTVSAQQNRALVAPLLTGSGWMGAAYGSGAYGGGIYGGAPATVVIVNGSGIVIAAPVLTGAGALLAPDLGLSSTVAAPVLAGSGLMPAPTISAGLVIAAPLLTGSGQLLPGVPSLRVTAPALAGSGVLLAGTPSVLLGAPVLNGSGLLPSPSLSRSAILSAPVLSGSGALLPGTPALILSAPVLSGSGLILNGSIALSQVIQAAVMRGSGALPVPQLVIITPLPGWGIIQAREPVGIAVDASLKGAAMIDRQAFGVIVAMDPTGQINRGEPFALIVDVSPRGKG